ncbi:hypothetical protein SOCEGT47_050350 [Sorangium cellulosum]|uniref:Uncharacterized protein n=1 Tax=Sorangium cellulosum TaxID=56 RepID=A0A4P2Q518_SORCE|nr:hypothetical protein SOCEGT47_050350 [Sorangium cellulosum]
MKNRIFLRGSGLALCGLATAALVACAGAAEDDGSGGAGSTGASTTTATTGTGTDTTSTTTATTGTGTDTTSTTTATTGSGTDTTSTTTATTGSGGGAPQTIEMIDDMEDDNNGILAEGNRVGYWYTFNDGTEGAEQMPPPDPEGTGEEPFTMTALEPVRGASTMAARSWGSGFETWGAAFGFDLNSPEGTKIAYDASAYTGVTFWAKIGPGSATSAQVMISDRSTVPEGGVCSDQCDNWQKQITLTEAWQQFTIPFADLKQGGWGDPAATDQIDTTKLYSISFQFGTVPEFDLYIDDIGFYN